MGENFEDLEVWKRSCRLAVEIYELLKNRNGYGLRDQMSRAAVSIPSNIAEGGERNSKAEFKRFLKIAKGSAGELRTQVYIASRVNLIDSNKAKSLVKELKEISRMLQGLIDSV